MKFASDAAADSLIAASSGPLFVDRGVRESQAPPKSRALRLREPGPIAATHIVQVVELYLTSVPGGGAVLYDVICHVADVTGYDKKKIGPVIRQHFRTNGVLVWH